MIKVLIREAAEARGIENPTQLANLMGCAPTIIWRYWEKKQIPGLPMVDRVCEALNCDLKDVLVRVANKRKNPKAAKAHASGN